MNHNLKHDMENETLPPADELFDDMPELKFEALEKKLSLETPIILTARLNININLRRYFMNSNIDFLNLSWILK